MRKAILVISVLSIYIGGCGNKFWDPTQVGRFRPVPAINVILDSLGVAEETPSIFESAEKPRPSDVVAYETDYVFGPGDAVRISVFELFREGGRYVNDFVITETGKVSIPEIGVVELAGLTESQAEEEIKQILSPTILKDPSVTVTLMNSQQRTYAIWGNGVPRPGRFPIPRYNLRLTEVIASSGVTTQFNVSYIYVTRSVTGKENINEPVSKQQFDIGSEREMLGRVTPNARQKELLSRSNYVIASSEMITDEELKKAALPDGLDVFDVEEERKELEWKFQNGRWVQVEVGRSEVVVEVEPEAELEIVIQPPVLETIEPPIIEEKAGRIEWVFQGGKWIPVQIGKSQVTKSPVKAKRDIQREAEPEFGWEEIETGGVQNRVIEIPTDRLAGGDPRYNIVIRPGDSIHIPLDVIGEFCVMGNVSGSGFIPLTGRRMTLKMAIAAAGGLGPLAWPKRVEVTRRIGKDREETVMVDLDKISTGEQPDFFIKPLDLINVGTHVTARWRAVLRNSFRATYGFGFLYDRNFADRDFGTSRPLPNWF